MSKGFLEVEDASDGWPAFVTLRDGVDTPITLHMSQVGFSHRGRDDHERRFQNPGAGRPIERVPGRLPLLLGAWEVDGLIDVDRPVFVLVDAYRRINHKTRFSVFVALQALLDAERFGWSDYESESGERILCFWPELLPVAAALLTSDVDPDESLMERTLAAARSDRSVEGDGASTPRRKLRREVTMLSRDARFRGAVLDSYGRTCAMCGLGLSIVEGAHILPVSAPLSNDDPSNGLALCPNHHRAFDRHQVAVMPDDMTIVFHPSILSRAIQDQSTAHFVEGTYQHLRQTVPGTSFIDARMLESRYDYFFANYQWLQA